MTIIYETLFVLSCIISFITILFLSVRKRQLQKALYWLQIRHYQKMRYEAEVIREGILQDLFSFRRGIELSQVKSQGSQVPLERYDLETFEKIHHSLTKLSEYLYPAHVDDSLSLATNCLLKSWKLNIPELNIEMNISNQEYEQENYELNQIILMILEELFEIILPLISEQVSILINLDMCEHQKKLQVQICSPLMFKLKSKYCSEKLDYIKKIFEFLIHGKCFYCQEDSKQIWYFNWYSPKQAITEHIENKTQIESFIKLIN